jgi:hypothetical protein
MPNLSIPKSPKLVIGAVAIAIVFFALISLLYIRLFDFDRKPGILLPDPATWAQPIRELRTEMAKDGVNVDRFEVRLVYGSRPSIGSSFMCRMSDSPHALEFLKRRIGLVQGELDHRGWYEELLPRDWTAQPGATTEYFISHGWVNGDEGELWRMAHDPSQHQIFVEYYFNF